MSTSEVDTAEDIEEVIDDAIEEDAEVWPDSSEILQRVDETWDIEAREERAACAEHNE